MKPIIFALALVMGCSLVSTTRNPTSNPNATAVDMPGSANGNLTVPNLIGKTEAEAIELVKAAGFNHPVETRMLSCDNAAKVAGKISCQDPQAGQVVEKYALVQVEIYVPHVFKGMVVRDQLRTLIGLTPEQAKAQLVKFGHDGEVVIATVMNSGGGESFVKGCGENRVCELSEDAGMGIHDPITLYINPHLTIAPP